MKPYLTSFLLLLSIVAQSLAQTRSVGVDSSGYLVGPTNFPATSFAAGNNISLTPTNFSGSRWGLHINSLGGQIVVSNTMTALAIRTILSNAVSGSCILFKAGYYDLGTNSIYAAKGACIHGEGADSTILQCFATVNTNGPAFVPQDNQRYYDLSFWATNASPTVAAALGTVWTNIVGLTAQPGSTNVYFVRCKTYADSDSIYVVNANLCKWTFVDCTIKANWDSITIYSNANHEINLSGCKVIAAWPSAYGEDQLILQTRNVNLEKGQLYADNTIFISTNAPETTVGIEMSDINLSSVTLNNSAIFIQSTNGAKYSVTGTGKFFARNSRYDWSTVSSATGLEIWTNNIPQGSLLRGAVFMEYTNTPASLSNYTLPSFYLSSGASIPTEYIVSYEATNELARTITIPALGTLGQERGRIILLKDGNGTAGATNITIYPLQGTDNRIDRLSTSFVLDHPFAWIMLQAQVTNWVVLNRSYPNPAALNVGFTNTTIAGAGTGNTNFTLNATANSMFLGNSNVNVVASMGYNNNATYKWTAIITNLSTINWGVRFSPTTNQWSMWNDVYGTNQPSVLTNGFALMIDAQQTGTNIYASYQYFRAIR